MNDSLDYQSDEADEELLKWDLEPTTTTWKAASAQPTRRTFASRLKQKTRPSARKALQMGERAVATQENQINNSTASAFPGEGEAKNNSNFSFKTSKAWRSTSDIKSAPSPSMDVVPPTLERKPRRLGSFFMNRAHTLPTSQQLPPRSQKAGRMQRSHSLALGSTPKQSLMPRRSESLVLEEEDTEAPPFWETGLDITHNKSREEVEAELLDGNNSSRGRKKHRARRASIQGTTASLSELFKNHQDSPSIPPPPPLPLPRSLSASSSPSKLRSASESMIDFSMGSPSTSSRASSGRKRGYCGSPSESETLDDASLGGMSSSMNSIASRRSRSRSRIFASSPMSVPPAFDPALGAMDLPPVPLPMSGPNNYTKKKQPYQPDECRGMDHSSDEEDGHASDDNEGNLSTEDHGESFTNSAGCEHAVPVIAIPTCATEANDMINPSNSTDQSSEEELPGGTVFQTMSSYEDLKFLIKTLRKEAKGFKAASFFGSSRVTSWTVAPPQKWKSERRGEFFKWTTAQYPFVVRTLGNSITVLQISKTNGEQLLQELEDALVSYKEKTATVEEGAIVKKPCTTAEASPFGVTNAAPAPVLARPTKPSNRTKDTSNNLFGDIGNDCEATDELISGLRTLSMTNESRRTSDVSLQVGGDFVEIVATERSSMDASASMRPSFDHSVVGATDMMLHLHGHSPEKSVEEAEVLRPPKMSLASVGSCYSRGRPSAPYAIQNLDVFETPQIKQDEGWGSRPIDGKDWGSSLSCDGFILDVLMDRFEEAGRIAGVNDSEVGGLCLPVMPDGLEMEDPEAEYEEDDASMQDNTGQEFHDEKTAKRLEMSYAKYKRVSLFAAGSQDAILPGRKSVFHNQRGRQSLEFVEEIPKSLHEYEDSFPIREASACETSLGPTALEQVMREEDHLVSIFAFLTESELLCKASLISTTWAGAATTAHAALMMASVGYMESGNGCDQEADVEWDTVERSSVSISMDRDWRYLTQLFPWACFLSSGAFKRVFKVYNSSVQAEEAVSVMDVDEITDKKTIASELIVTSMLSAMSRRGICPNFVVMHGVFTMPYDVPESVWGSEVNKRPKGAIYNPRNKKARAPRQPKEAFPGRYQFIRMELCNEGDMEEFLKRQDNRSLSGELARATLFQIAFALHAAADRHSLKHYDIKLLNVFVQGVQADTSNVVLRYGLGSHVFALELPAQSAFYAKLADYGTANVQPESTGLPVTIAQFTTLENTPPDYLILGDLATQGHGHDNFGLGLSMLHLFTGHAPYEEILEDVVCPPMLKKKLRAIWENEKMPYSVIRSVILSDVYQDDRGHIVEGEPDETLYDTLYRFLVLFGIPPEEERFDQRKCPAIWKAISDTLNSKESKGRRQKQGTDVAQYEKDCQKFSIRWGSDFYIARARNNLRSMEGGIDLLLQLCSFNPHTRATSLQVLNSSFMEALREESSNCYDTQASVFSYTAFSTHQ